MYRLWNSFKKHFGMILTKNRKKNLIWNSLILYGFILLLTVLAAPGWRKKVWLCPCLSVMSLVYPLNFEWFPLLCFNQSIHREHSCFFSSFIFHVIFFLPPINGFVSGRIWYLVNNLTLLLSDRSDSLQSFQMYCFFICMHHSHHFHCRLDQSQY